jgi:hypothetical protein
MITTSVRRAYRLKPFAAGMARLRETANDKELQQASNAS